MKRKTRDLLSFLSFLLFPVTLNFFSPYVSIDGAMIGVISGSVIVFFVMFLSGIFLGRGWCSYVCPWAAPSTFLRNVNNKTVNRRKLAIVRYVIFGVWFSFILFGFIMAGGIQGINPLHLTEHIISVDEPLKYITYYGVIGILFLLTVLIGRRGACHSLCWMSPFLQAGMWVGRKLRFPQYKVISEPSLCINCKKCDNACPMSIEVNETIKSGKILSYDCILCGNCVDVCPKNVLQIRMKKPEK